MVSTHRVNAHTASFWLLAITVLLLPILLGGNRPLAFGIAQVGLGLFFLVYSRAVTPHIPFAPRLKWSLGLFALVLGWGWLQTTTFTPAAWHHPLWSEATALIPSIKGSISLTPELSLLVLQRYITYMLLFIGVYSVAKDPTNARRLCMMFWVTGVALCVCALLQYEFLPGKLLWLDRWAYKDDLTGVFVNRNHFADYAGLVFVTGFANMWQSLRGLLKMAKGPQRIEALQVWLVKSGVYYMISLIVVLLSILLSHSRAGLAVTAVGTIGFIFCYLVYQRHFKTAVTMTVLSAVLAVGVFSAIADTGRFSSLFKDYSSSNRLTVYELTSDAVLGNPWFGHGLGSFEAGFHLYRDTSLIMGDIGFNRAHNDWLEAAFDLGIPGALVLFASIGLLLSACWRGVRKRQKDGLYPALALGASLLVLAHALVDFNLQMPGIVVSWLLLLGCGTAQSYSPRENL